MLPAGDGTQAVNAPLISTAGESVLDEAAAGHHLGSKFHFFFSFLTKLLHLSKGIDLWVIMPFLAS